MKIFGWLMVAFLAFLPGCGPDGAKEAGSREKAASAALLRLCLVGDPFALVLRQEAEWIRENSGISLDISLFSYEEMRIQILLNGKSSSPVFDLVSFDVVWLGELVREGALMDLQRWEDSLWGPIKEDYFSVAFDANRWEDRLYGLPFQGHSEILWYRKDLFEAEGIEPPRTTGDVIAAGRHFHDPENDFYGICWNAHQGHALGQTVAHLLGAVEQPLLEEDGFPAWDPQKTARVTDYLQDMLSVSPPDILSMAWDLRIQRFAQGKAAMTYGWTARQFMVEDPRISKVAGKVGYVAAPIFPGAQPISPFGQWSLGVPSNLDPQKLSTVRTLLDFLYRPSTVMYLAGKGHLGTANRDVLRDPGMVENNPVFPVLLALDEREELSTSMRPPVPQWSLCSAILGQRIFDFLQGEMEGDTAFVTAEEAIRESIQDESF